MNDQSNRTPISHYTHVNEVIQPAPLPIVAKMEEWSRVTAYGVTPPAQATSVNVNATENGIGKISPSSSTSQVNLFAAD